MMRKCLGCEDEEKVVELYKQGLSSIKIANHFGISKSTILSTLHNRNVKMRNNRAFSNEVEVEIVESYKEGNSVLDIGAIYSVHCCTIARVLDRRGIACRGSRRHKVDAEFFQDIDREEQAYWLSFIYADGCVDRKKLKIKLQIGDKKHLSKFSKTIGYTGPVYLNYENEFPFAQVQIYNTKLTSRLQKLGIIPARSAFRLVERELPEHLDNHFIRGYFDGDGSILLSSGGTPYIHFYGQPDILSWIKWRLVNQTGASSVPRIRDSGRIKVITFAGFQQVKRIIEYLYSGATVFLDRKKDTADFIIGLPESRKERARLREHFYGTS